MPLLTKPNIKAATYVEVIQNDYPDKDVYAEGDGTDYDKLHAVNWTLPDKATLDIRREYWTRVNVWMAIKAERDARRANGVPVLGYWLHSDDSSRIQQLGLVIFGANLPPIQWKTMDGRFVTMTPPFALAIFQASATNDVAIFTAAETHKARMMVSSNPVTYDFSTGWPTTYTGSLLL